MIILLRFGIVHDDFEVTNVRCNGTEEIIEDCPYSDSNDCGQSDGAGVICRGNV